MTAKSRSTAHKAKKSSPSKYIKNSLFANSVPALRAEDNPPFVLCKTTILLSIAAYSSQILPLKSVEPSSTRMISISFSV